MKIRCFLLIMIIIIQSAMHPAFAEDSKVKDYNNANVIGSFHFEENSDQPANTANASVKNIGGAHKNVLSLSTSRSEAFAYFIFDKTVSSGKLSVSYDVYSAQKNKEAYTRMLEGPYTTMTGDCIGHYFEGYIIRNIGVIQMFNNTSWNVDNAPMIEYDANRWYHVDMWFDFENRTASYYIDGELLGKTSMAKDFDQMRGFVHDMYELQGEQWLDNVYAVEFTGGGNDMSKFPYIQGYPRTVEQTVMTEVSIPKTGHAYFGKNVNVSVKAVEGVGKPFNGKLRLTLYSEDGKSTFSEKKFSLKPGEEKKTEISASAPRYGYYEIEVSCINNDGNSEGNASESISVIAPTEKLNPKIGFSAHISKNYGFIPDKVKMAAEAGVGTIRDEIRWTEFETTRGIFKPDKFTQGYIDFTNETNQNKFAILGYWFPGRTLTGLPRTEEDIKAFKAYVTKVLEYTKDMDIDYELWNEQNMYVGPDYGSIQDYVDLAKLVYPLKEKINPDAKLYVLAVANVETVREYVEECFKLGIGDYCDGVTIHPYNVTIPPDDAKFQSDVYDIADLMEKYGLSDKELVISEVGWTTSVGWADEDMQADYTIRSAALYSDIAEKIYFYNLQEKSTGTMTDTELHFGFLRGWAYTPIPYEPKPAFLALSNYNRLMTGSDKVKKLEHSDKDVSMHLFKNANGKNTIIAWSTGKDTETAINTGADKVTICDIYGNESIISTRNGIVDLTLSSRPIYIIGDIKEVSEVAPTFNINQKEMQVTENDILSISGNATGGEWIIEAECPDNIMVTDISPINENGSFTINFKTGAAGRKNEYVTVKIKDKKSNNIVYANSVRIVYIQPVGVDANFKYYKNSHWQMVLKITNNKRSESLSGTVKLTEPEDMEIPKSECMFSELSPGGTRYIYVNVPIEKSMDKMTMNGYVEIESGERILFGESTYFVALAHLGKTPEIDGKIDDNEYVSAAPVRINNENMVKQIPDWKGVKDLSANIYLNYDRDYFYLAARVTDNLEGATAVAADIWQNDSIQFAFAEIPLLTAGRTEIGIGKDKDGKAAIQRYSFLGTKFFAADIDEAIAFDESCELQIGREGNDTIYELRMPWVDIYGEKAPVFSRRSVLFSIIVNDNDGTGRRGWMEFCPGIGSEKDASLFMKVPVMQN